MKTEDWFKGKLMGELRHEMPSGVHLRHEDQFTSGIPDVSSTWNYGTLWAECKAVCPAPGRELRTTGIQILTCLRLAAVGRWCRYLVWVDDIQGKAVVLIHPETMRREFSEGRTKLAASKVRALGDVVQLDHDFKTTAAWMRRLHETI